LLYLKYARTNAGANKERKRVIWYLLQNFFFLFIVWGEEVPFHHIPQQRNIVQVDENGGAEGNDEYEGGREGGSVLIDSCQKEYMRRDADDNECRYH